MWLASFAPSLAAMLLPVAALWLVDGFQAPHPVFAKWRELLVKATARPAAL